MTGPEIVCHTVGSCELRGLQYVQASGIYTAGKVLLLKIVSLINCVIWPAEGQTLHVVENCVTSATTCATSQGTVKLCCRIPTPLMLPLSLHA